MILDRQAVLDRIEQDQELYDELCGIFKNDAPNILAELKKALTAGNIPVATRHTHSLKSAAANIGATELCATASLAENAFRAGNFKSIHNLITEIELNLERVLEVLK